jgi:hypothetical protein
MGLLHDTPSLPIALRERANNVGWLLFVSGALATFRLSHLVSKERGAISVFERIRNALPRGRGSAQEWLSCIFCFSLTASARLRASLDRWFASHSAGMDRSLARLQCSSPDN